jgi:MFS family permease
LSIGTVGVGFFARPVGAIILSHFADRLGRKSVLILTLVSVGGATTIIGLLPHICAGRRFGADFVGSMSIGAGDCHWWRMGWRGVDGHRTFTN